MKRLLLGALILCVGALVFRTQHHRRSLIEKQNTRLAAMAETLRRRAQASAQTQALADEKIRPLEGALAAQQAPRRQGEQQEAPPLAPEPPDTTRQGGWPAHADYFYLPKTFLQQASFQVLDHQQLTDEAASLFNLTEPERQEVNRAIGDLFVQLRSAESERMQLIDLPVEWASSREFSSGVAYYIPSFSDDVATWRQQLQQRLESILGPERRELLGTNLEDHLRQNWNDLGENERTVGFVWHPESNGTQSLWSATKDQRNGDGTFRRYLPGGPDEETFRHYADLFGVELK